MSVTDKVAADSFALDKRTGILKKIDKENLDAEIEESPIIVKDNTIEPETPKLERCETPP